ncbi:glycogen debranching N-terminal domain-containing protein [Variovorax sp. KK3]|uniref:amylo-alpha-1,6-glucosidase n=1 Tax=Variovorax sp. KK3 TaxID=1855728 RepID=UPI00097C1C94|nr:glycogen debranching N-terminal domain-containing protein [Variovorax sp. KK3]
MSSPHPQDVPNPQSEASNASVPRTPDHLYVLKDGDSFVVADTYGDIAGSGDGFFMEDTRLLSCFHLLLGGERPTLLSSSVSRDNVFFTAHATNRPLPPLGDESLPQGVVHIERRRLLWDGLLRESITLKNYSLAATRLQLTVVYGADFSDTFEVRGERRSRRGEFLPAKIQGKGVELSYRGLDGVERRTRLAFSTAPDAIDEKQCRFDLVLNGREDMVLYVDIGPSAVSPTRAQFRAASAAARRSMRTRQRTGARVRTSARQFQAWVDRSEADLALLTTALPTGPYPYAGIPWFSTPFGRDAIITALQTLWLKPSLARGVLAYLASQQARETSAFRDAEPGKIMHEQRKGEMTALGELPFGRYYGGVDTTPLFVTLAAAYARRTADVAFITDLWPSLVAATAWIQGNAKRHGGFLSYARAQASGLANQGWKDSHDSIFHEDGRTPEGPIALVEVQGYAVAALRGMAEMAAWLGHDVVAAPYADAAEAWRGRVESRFWQEDMQFYALALDGGGEPCRVYASNTGHLLYMGLPGAERGRAVARQLLASGLDSGWGLRTLSSKAIRFNPMSYHNGSVWPHDVALCAAGMARYGERNSTARLTSEMFECASRVGMRLPELFCGFERMSSEAPVSYPVACLPQAWAAGSVFMLLQGCLGIDIDAMHGRIVVERPVLPTEIESLVLRDLRLPQGAVDISLSRRGGSVQAAVSRHSGAEALQIDLRL